MERTENRDSYRLSTGREIDAHLGIIGIVTDEIGGVVQGWRIFGGYDDYVFVADLPPSSVEDEPLTPDERIELANFMIAQWQAYRESAYIGWASIEA